MILKRTINSTVNAYRLALELKDLEPVRIAGG